MRRRMLSVLGSAALVSGAWMALAGSAMATSGWTAYVTNNASHSVTPIDTATNMAGTAISVGIDPGGVAITPDGKTAYVANSNSNSVTPIDTATNTAGTP